MARISTKNARRIRLGVLAYKEQAVLMKRLRRIQDPSMREHLLHRQLSLVSETQMDVLSWRAYDRLWVRDLRKRTRSLPTGPRERRYVGTCL